MVAGSLDKSKARPPADFSYILSTGEVDGAANGSGLTADVCASSAQQIAIEAYTDASPAVSAGTASGGDPSVEAGATATQQVAAEAYKGESTDMLLGTAVGSDPAGEAGAAAAQQVAAKAYTDASLDITCHEDHSK
jgi:hypothetical protein